MASKRGAVLQSPVGVPAGLRVPPSGVVPPPIDTKTDLLPLDKLAWPDVERLFLRLAERKGRAEYAELYGTPGQRQEGIDLFVRNTRGAEGRSSADPARRYTTLQSKHLKTLSPTGIVRAVDKFLKGTWAGRSEVFVYATTHTLRPTRLADELVRQADRLEEEGIRFEPWGREWLSERLRQLPEIVDDFFGRPWVARFCGSEAADALGSRLPGRDVTELRTSLRGLYRTSFALQDTGAMLLNPAASAQEPAPLEYVMLDITGGAGDIPVGGRADTVGRQGLPDGRQAGRHLNGDGGENPALAEEDAFGTRTPWQNRDEVPVVDRMLQLSRVEDDLGGPDVTRSACDEWLAEGDLSVVAGGPGAGKSSLLRFVVSDLLDEAPRSSPLATKFGSRLPVWLPFSFLCEYLKGDAERSIESAVRAWLTRYSAPHLHDLVTRALADNRLLLVVDGLDEWTDEDSAHPALTLLENFVRSRDIAAMVSSRPYALRRLMPLAGWRMGTLAPLSEAQQQSMARAAFTRVVSAEPAAPADLPGPSRSAQHLRRDTADRFLDEVKVVAALKALAAVPLFLLMLAGMWSNGPLPTRRMQAYQRLVDVLVEQHPAIRRRGTHRPGTTLAVGEIRQVLAAVAYELRRTDTGPAAGAGVWRANVVRALCDDDLLGYDPAEARRLAPQIMETAEGDLGILIPQGAGTLGFAHRAVAEQLAAEHLTTLPLTDLKDIVRARIADRSWRDVLLALLAGQDRPSEVADLLQTATTAGPANSPAEMGGHELAAEALAAGIRMPQRDVRRFSQLLCDRVESHPWMPHRARLLAALTGALTETTASRVLLPWFARKATATTDDPNAYWALRHPDTAGPGAETILVRALEHPSPLVKRASAHALAQRAQGSADVARSLASLVSSGSEAHTQAVALDALVTGWSSHALTRNLITWGMRQGAVTVRAVALRAHRALQRDASADGTAPAWDENDRQRLLGLLEQDSVTDLWDLSTAEMLSEAARDDESVRDLCLAILSGKPGRPGTPGSRNLAWWVLLTAFADDPSVVAWAACEIASDGYLPHDLTHVPDSWADDPAIRDAAQSRLLHNSSLGREDLLGLTRLARTDQVRDHLIKALDAAYGTAAAARVLQHHYGDDPTVREVLLRKIGGPADDAVAFAEITGAVLGPEVGIGRLVQLIEQRPRQGVQHVIAALGSLWIDCKETARGQSTAFERPQAERALQRYDAQTLATLCIDAVPGDAFGTARGWIIGAWPEVPDVLAYARQCLSGPSPETGAVLIGYGPLGGPESAQIVADATALLNPLPPALRALIAQQLTRRGIDADIVTELLKDWRHDTSGSVRRAAATALALTLAPVTSTTPDSTGAPVADSAAARQTHQQHALQRLRTECRQELLARDLYTGDDRRRTAWALMLLLGDVTLLEGVTERHDGRPVTVEFGDSLSDYDPQLTELIASYWTALQQQSDDGLPERLGGRLEHSPADLVDVWSRLANVAARYPDLDRALNDAVRTTPELLRDKRVFAWYADTSPEDPRLLTYAAQAAEAAADPRPVLHAVSRIRPADARRQELLRILVDPPDRKTPPQLIIDDDIDEAVTGWRRTALARLLPDDPHGQSLYRKLSKDLTDGREIHWTWPEAIAVTIGLAPAAHVPHLVLSIAERLQRRDAVFAAPDLLGAAAHRIRRDPEAEEAVIAAILSPDSMDTSAFAWNIRKRTYSAAADRSAHCQIILAGILSTASGLPADVAAALELLTDNDSVLHDNLLMTPRPIRFAVLDLLDAVR